MFSFQHIGLYQDVERGTAVSVDCTKRDNLVVVSQLALITIKCNPTALLNADSDKYIIRNATTINETLKVHARVLRQTSTSFI